MAQTAVVTAAARAEVAMVVALAAATAEVEKVVALAAATAEGATAGAAWVAVGSPRPPSDCT